MVAGSPLKRDRRRGELRPLRLLPGSVRRPRASGSLHTRLAVKMLIVRGRVGEHSADCASSPRHCSRPFAPREDVSMRETWDFSMPLEEAMTTQRAVRRLKPDPVDDALVLRLIELALKAPSGSNAQNWEFVMVKDRAAKARLGTLNRGAFRIYGGLGRWLARNDPRMLRIIAALQWQAGPLPPHPR